MPMSKTFNDVMSCMYHNNKLVLLKFLPSCPFSGECSCKMPNYIPPKIMNEMVLISLEIFSSNSNAKYWDKTLSIVVLVTIVSNGYSALNFIFLHHRSLNWFDYENRFYPNW